MHQLCNFLKFLFAPGFKFFNLCSCDKYLLNTYYMLGIVLDTEYISEQKELWSLFSSGRDNKVYSRFSEEHDEEQQELDRKSVIDWRGRVK